MKIIRKKIHDKTSRALMMEGIDQLADVVGSTLGAKGRAVVLDKDWGAPLVVNDGVTIAREIFFDDPIRNMGAQLVKDAAIRTNDLAGDGTTSSTVLARAIVREGWKLVDQGENPVQVRKSLDKSLLEMEKVLKGMKEDVNEEKQAIQIATVSVQDPELGEKIGKLVYKVGANGAVSIKNSMERGVQVVKEDGMRLEGALVGGFVQNQEKWETKFENARVLILRDSPDDHELESKWLTLARQFASGNRDPNGNVQVTAVHVPVFVVVAEKLSTRFIMFMNRNNETVKWLWFRPSTAGKNMKEIYADLASMVGGKIVCEEEGVMLGQDKQGKPFFTINDLGTAMAVTANRHEIIFTVSPQQLLRTEFLSRITEVKGQMVNAEDEIEKNQIRERYAGLTGGVATLKVAGATDQETNELRLRIEDAVNATRSAMGEGYVAGGGVALLNASRTLGNSVGDAILKKACEAPIRQILKNAGYEDGKIDKTLSKLKEGEGVNVLTDEVVDLKSAGVVDPLPVVQLSLIHAVSVAGLLLTSEYVVTSEEDDTEKVKEFFRS